MREGDIARGIPVTPRLMRVTVAELLEDVKNDYKVNGKKSYPDLEYRCRLYLEPFFGAVRASAVTTADVRNFILKRQTQGGSNTAINRELTALKRAFSLAVQAGKILMKPHIPMLAENNVGLLPLGLDVQLPKNKQPWSSMTRVAWVTDQSYQIGSGWVFANG